MVHKSISPNNVSIFTYRIWFNNQKQFKRKKIIYSEVNKSLGNL